MKRGLLATLVVTSAVGALASPASAKAKPTKAACDRIAKANTLIELGALAAEVRNTILKFSRVFTHRTIWELPSALAVGTESGAAQAHAAFNGLLRECSRAHPETRRYAKAIRVGLAIPPTTTLEPAAPPTYPSGASVVQTACPVEVAPQSRDDVSGQSSPITQDVVVHQYAVHGNTAPELRVQVAQCGPQDGGQTVAGLTKWYVSWNYGFDSSSGCHIAWAKVHVQVDVYLPQWDDASGSRLESSWNRFLAALIDHESGHMQHGIDAANQAASAMNTLPPADTCADLDTQASQAGQRVLDEFNQQDIAYDNETGHGTSEGAVLALT